MSPTAEQLPRHEVQELSRQLGITVPIYKATRQSDGSIDLHLYGGFVYHHPAGARRQGDRAGSRPAAVRGQDDFTAIKGVGSKADRALRGAGYRTFAELDQASDDELLELRHVHTGKLRNIRRFLAERGRRASPAVRSRTQQRSPR